MIGFCQVDQGYLVLALAVDESPAVGRDLFLLEDRQDRLERAAVAAGHELGAEQRTVEGFELGDATVH